MVRIALPEQMVKVIWPIERISLIEILEGRDDRRPSVS
jgi:hypothetical protein